MPHHTDEIGAPLIPQKHWLFEVPDWVLGLGAGDIHVETDGPEVGRAAGLYYDHDVAYLNDTSAPWHPPASPTGNEAFHVGHIDYRTGQADLTLASTTPTHDDWVPVGTISAYGGHSSVDMSFEEAQANHDKPEYQRLQGTLWDVMLPRSDGSGERQVGLFLGAATPNTTFDDALTINRSGLSGEWWPRFNMRTIHGTITDGLDALGPVLVSRAAIPTNRAATLQRTNPDCPACERLQHTMTTAATGTISTPTINIEGDRQALKAAAASVQSHLAPVQLHNPATIPTNAVAASPCCEACRLDSKTANTDADRAQDVADSMSDGATRMAARVEALEARQDELERLVGQFLAEQMQDPAALPDMR